MCRARFRCHKNRSTTCVGFGGLSFILEGEQIWIVPASADQVFHSWNKFPVHFQISVAANSSSQSFAKTKWSRKMDQFLWALLGYVKIIMTIIIYTIYTQKKYNTLEHLKGSVIQCFDLAIEVTAEQMQTVSLVKSWTWPLLIVSHYNLRSSPELDYAKPQAPFVVQPQLMSQHNI